MDRSGLPTRQWLTATIVVHLVISIVHGMAHNQAEVPLSPAANLFVIVVSVDLLSSARTWCNLSRQA